MAGAVALSLTTVTLSADDGGDAAKGQKIYSKKLKADCGFNGGEFAKKHTQDEWEQIGTDGLKDEIKKICPKADVSKIKDKYLKDLSAFTIEFASDSGNVPSC